MTDTRELNELIARAEQRGACVLVTWDEDARRDEGREITRSRFLAWRVAARFPCHQSQRLNGCGSCSPMRNISFMLTTDQIRQRTKTVTRRLNWQNLQPGTRLQGCVKCMGLRAGEQIEKLAVIEVVSVRRERLDLMSTDPVYGQTEAIAEGFPELDGPGFVAKFCGSQDCTPDTEITRIEFRYVDTTTTGAPRQAVLF